MASPSTPNAETDPRSVTVAFESPWTLEALFTGDVPLLKEMGRTLDVRLTVRDADLTIMGEEKAIAATRRVFESLESALRQGVPITPDLVRYTLRQNTVGLGSLLEHKLLGNSRRPPVVPKNESQLLYLQKLRTTDVVFGIGAAGTGKTYLAVAHALARLKANEVGKIILTRPAVEAGEALGFLPGDMKEKIFPYLRPLFDALYDMIEPAEVEKYIDKAMIEIAPLAYMRGRTLNRCHIILDEAQNTTREQMLMFLTRLGADSRCVITGDPSQIDLRQGTRSGLHEAMRVLRDVQGIAFVEFVSRDVVRNPVVQRIIEAYDQARRANPVPQP